MNTNEIEWWIEGGANLPNGKFIRNRIFKEREVNKFRFEYNNVGVFSTIYKYDNRDQKTANLLADFYLDIDNADMEKAKEDALEAIKYILHNYGIDTKFLKIYFSGKKGFHILVPSAMFDIKPCPNLNLIYRIMVEDLKKSTVNDSIDMKIYDKRRLLRLPNSVHPSTKLYKIPITYSELKSLSCEQIQSLAKEPRTIATETPRAIKMASMIFNNYKTRVNNKKPPKDFDNVIHTDGYVPPCISYVLTNAVKEGTRNTLAAALTSFYRQCGLEEEQVKVKIGTWNRACCDPQMTSYEIQTTVRSVYSGAYKMGCTWLSSVAPCDKPNCKINKNRR